MAAQRARDAAARRRGGRVRRRPDVLQPAPAAPRASRKPSREQVAAYPVVYCVFDLLEIDGEDLTGPAAARAPRPAGAGRRGRARHCSSPRPGATTPSAGSPRPAGSGWEGLIAKRADAPYARGRSKDWLKLKCAWEQEFVIGGYTEPAGSRTDFGALLVGYYEDGQLRYAGKVGTGYTAATLRDLGARLRKLEIAESPFVDARPIPRGTHWTRPELVAQIGFAEWTTRRSAAAARASSGCATTSAPPTSSGSVPREHELLEEARRRLNQHYGLVALLGHMHMQIDLAPDHVAIEPVSACLSRLGIFFEGLDADESETTGPARIDRHASDIRTFHVLESLH